MWNYGSYIASAFAPKAWPASEAELHFGKIAHHNAMKCSVCKLLLAQVISLEVSGGEWLHRKKSEQKNVVFVEADVHKHSSYCGTKNNSSVFGNGFFTPRWMKLLTSCWSGKKTQFLNLFSQISLLTYKRRTNSHVNKKKPNLCQTNEFINC